MLMSLILAATLCGQARPSQAEIDAKTAKLRAEINARAAARAEAGRILRRAGRPTLPPASLDRTTIDKRQAKREAIARQEARQQAVERQEQAEAAATAERLLPYQLEAQRQALENQRQWLERQSAMERNAVLNRAVGALERRAGYVTPGNSPIPQAPPVVTNPMWWAY